MAPAQFARPMPDAAVRVLGASSNGKNNSRGAVETVGEELGSSILASNRGGGRGKPKETRFCLCSNR